MAKQSSGGKKSSKQAKTHCRQCYKELRPIDMTAVNDGQCSLCYKKMSAAMKSGQRFYPGTQAGKKVGGV